MPLDLNSSPSNSSSDRDDRSPNSDPNSLKETEVHNSKNPDLIDQSLDALENQLASISMSSRSPTATFEDEQDGLEEAAESQEQPYTMNGKIGAEGDADFEEDQYFEANSKALSPGVNDESVSYRWRDAPEVCEVERPLSPGSSGYAGEMGSTSGYDEINDDDEDSSEILVEENDRVSESHNQWVSAKRHADEDDA